MFGTDATCYSVGGAPLRRADVPRRPAPVIDAPCYNSVGRALVNTAVRRTEPPPPGKSRTRQQLSTRYPAFHHLGGAWRLGDRTVDDGASRSRPCRPEESAAVTGALVCIFLSVSTLLATAADAAANIAETSPYHLSFLPFPQHAHLICGYNCSWQPMAHV